jgi:Nuclease-related domain
MDDGRASRRRIRPDAPPLQVGAGASAQREYERRRARRAESITTAHPRIGRFLLAISDDPQTTTAWQRGAEGERRVGAALERAGDSVLVLNDRRIPRTRFNIDHIAVAASGVYVIDTKMYSGKVAIRTTGGFFDRRRELRVGRRNCARDVEGVQWQARLVAEALDAAALTQMSVHGALCFADAEWPLLWPPDEFDGVLLESRRSLRRKLVRPGPVSATQAAAIHAALEAAFPPA